MTATRKAGRVARMAALAAALPLLPAAGPPPPPPATTAAQVIERDLRRTALSLVTTVRVAEGCRIRLAEPARRRAAELEAALLALPRAAGMRAADAATMRATREGAANAGRAWCSVQRADVEEVEELLASPEAETLLRRLRALRETRG
jgi:hypothetical protein